MKTKETGQLYGYFSEEAAKLCGTVFYRTPDERTVEVTAVYQAGEEGAYHWKDKVLVGPVNHWLCSGRKGDGW